MDTVHDESAVDYDEAFFGGSVPRSFASPHEPLPCQTPTASDPSHPLDDEGDMDIAAMMTEERRRIRDLAPGATVLVSKVVSSYDGDTGPHDTVQWQVSVQKPGAIGLCFADVAKMTLRQACDSALADYRAKVSAVAEEQAAA